MKHRDWRYIDNRIARALHALDEIAERLGDEWDDDTWDELSSARALVREFLMPEAADSHPREGDAE